MNKEYFTDNLSIEALAEITDEILKFEKSNKANNIKSYLFKIIPAAAMIALVIGIINILPILAIFNSETNSNKNPGENITGINAGAEITVEQSGDIIKLNDKTEPTEEKDIKFYEMQEILNKYVNAGDYQEMMYVMQSEEIAGFMLETDILFKPGMTELSEEGKKIIEFLGQTISAYLNEVWVWEVTVSVHTPLENQELSVSRADNIKNILLQAGLPEDIVYVYVIPYQTGYTLEGFAVNNKVYIYANRDIYTEFYTYDEYIKFDNNRKALWKSLINCTDENWMPVAGEPVLTQEMYDEAMANWDANTNKTLEDIKNGRRIPKMPQDSYPYAVYDTLADNMNLMCGIDKDGKWVLHNDGHGISETFNSKDEMLERARWFLCRALKAGEVDMAQSNQVYRRLYFADENDVNIIISEEKPEIKTIPIPPASSATVQRAYELGYRDSLEYTKFKDSSFAKRMNNLSAEESNFINKCMRAGECPPIADDIVGIYYDGVDGIATVTFELTDGSIVQFETTFLVSAPSYPNYADYTNYIEKHSFDLLKEINPDFYGWIKVSNTTISYPVLQTDDNSYYLYYNYEKYPSPSGAIFADYRNDRDVSKNRSTVIYGHNMLDRSMFQPLIDFGTNENYFKDGIIELITEDATYYYEIFSVHEDEPASENRIYDFKNNVDFKNDEEYLKFLNETKERSIFQKDIELDENSQIITLLTFVNDVRRAMHFVVHGVLVDVVKR